MDPTAVLPDDRRARLSAEVRRSWLTKVTTRLDHLVRVNVDPRANDGEGIRGLPQPGNPAERLVLDGLKFNALRACYRSVVETMLPSALGDAGAFPTPPAGDRSIAERLRNEVDVRLHEPLQLRRLARLLGATDGRLERAFRARYGQCVHEYVEARRLISALDYLRDPQLKIESIPAMVGYRSRSGFYVAFRRFYGRSPGEMRKALGSVARSPGAEDDAPTRIEQNSAGFGHVPR